MLTAPFRLFFLSAAACAVLPLSAEAAVVLSLDLGGAPSVNAAAHPANTVLTLELPEGEVLEGITFDIRGVINPDDVGDIPPFGGSRVSEVRIRVISSDEQIQWEHRPYSSPAYDHPSTSDSADLPGSFSGGVGLPWTVPAGGAALQVELYESLDDDPLKADGYYAAGSAVRFTVAGVVIPEPGIPALLSVLALAAFRRRRSRGND